MAALLALGISFVAVLSVGSAFRDNDQAMLIYGGLDLAQGRAHPLHTAFYNYDKQWGTYMLLGALYAAFPRLDPVLGGNLLQTVLLEIGILLALWSAWRRGWLPPWIAVTVFLSPVLILYLPYLATASLSLAFLLLAFAALRWRAGLGWTLLGACAVFVAGACRGDAVLAAPILALAGLPRRSLLACLRSARLWIVAAAAVLPVALGKAMNTRPEPDVAGLFFSPPIFAGFLVFALGLGALALLVLASGSRAGLLWKKRRWALFYGLELLAFLLPIGFYWVQLFSPRYFFLTIASLLFLVSSRRTGVLLGSTPRLVRWVVVGLAVLPWFVGVRMPHRREVHAVWEDATLFPTADGSFPMGGFGSFAWNSVVRDRYRIDHNQRSWESAKSVDYQACPDGHVPIIGTFMRNYLLLAVRLQGKDPLFVNDAKGAGCARAYLDLRSILRGETAPLPLRGDDLQVASRRPELGRPVLLADGSRPASATAESFWELRRVLGGRDAEVFDQRSVPFHADRTAADFMYFFLSAERPCAEVKAAPPATPLPQAVHVCDVWRPQGHRGERFHWTPPEGITVWAQTLYPDFMGR